MVSRSRFEQLVLAHRNDAYNLAYWILQSRDDAEDAVQDAYIRAFRAFDTFAGNDPRPWLLAIRTERRLYHLQCAQTVTKCDKVDRRFKGKER